MTIASKIIALFIAITLLLACALAIHTTQREHQMALNAITDTAIARVSGRVALQTPLYREDEQKLENQLASFLGEPAISLAAAYNSQGENLARLARTGTHGIDLPPFATMRGKASATDRSLLTFSSDGNPVQPGAWTSFTHPDSPIHLIIPVISTVDPAGDNLSDNGNGNGSQIVIGYVYQGIHPGTLMHGIGTRVSHVLFWYLGLLILPLGLVIWTTRQISQSVSRLAELTYEVTSDKLEKTMDIKGGPDIRKIVDMLNAEAGVTGKRESENHLTKHLMSLKADEHSSQLSKRDRELDTAAQEISATKQQLERMAYYDNLTALPNRRLFTEQLSLLLRINQRNKTGLALLLISLENFKRINDSLGHDNGDLILQEVANRLTNCLRGSDAVAYEKEPQSNIDVSRLEGDEFTVVLNQLSGADDITLVAQRLVDILVEPMMIGDTELVVTPNIGIAVSPGDADQVQGLFTAASAAMHHARDSKQARFLFYKPEMETAGTERIKLEADLRHAIDRGELLLHYQPQVDTISGSVTSAEALLRWQHPELGLVPPYKFIALAEEIGFISELGDWVLVEACRQMKAYIDRGLKLPKIAINISAMQFSSTFTRRVREVLADANLPPSMLELGLAESIMTVNDGSTIEALQTLKDKGVYLSVDDFGTSYSPMNYLSHYPLDEIKIDRSFVAGCEKSEGDAKLVQAIASMAAALDLNTVAEGVETEDQYRFLKRSGVSVMQGYFFSKPVTATELEGMLAPWHFTEKIQRITA